MHGTAPRLITPGTYVDIEIRILERQAEGYPVEITFSGEQEFPRGHLDPDFLPWIPSASPTDDGERLFEWLFADSLLRAAWAEVRGQNPLRRVRLRIDASAPELHAIPWELLRDASPGTAPQTLTADASTPFSRYLAGQWRPGSPVIIRPIRLLVAIANPTGLTDYRLAELDVEAERRAIEDAVSDLGADQLTLTFLEGPATLSTLEAELKQGYHILHVVAHGRVGGDREQAVLFLADGGNRVERVSETDFADMLSRQAESLRLVFLSSCQTATRSPADAFRGFAPRLIAAGVPAVLAMQDLVPINVAREFASIFYKRLLQHGYVDLASNEARSAVLTAKLSGAAVPVLFMRLRSGMLFGQRGQVFGERAESFWSILLDNIAEGACTPFLGPGVTQGFLPSPRELAQTLANSHNYPFADRDNLPRVSQFVGTLDSRRLRRDAISALTTGFKKRVGLPLDPRNQRLGLSDTITAVDWAELGQQLTEGEIHHRLADLGLPLYVTTNFDNFMTLALQAQGASPRRKTIAWRESSKMKESATKPHYDLDPPADSKESPVVLHLFGTDDDLLSMVLTEDDYLDYLACISRNYEYLLPTSVQEALASTTLLLLGYRLEDLDLKVIMRGLLTNLDLARWDMLHVAVQIEATETDEASYEDKNREVIRYFRKYFSKSRIDIYWGSVHQFVADLHARWKEHRDG
jgi:hypothetical protein